MSNIKLRTAAGGSVTLTPENVTGDVTLTVPGDNSTLVSSADLAASGGAGGVGYLPAGTGAVATTVQAKLRQVEVHADDYWQVGLSSYGVAINLAIARVQELGGGAVKIGPGEWQTGVTLALPDNVVLKGAGQKATTIKLKASSNVNIIEKKAGSLGIGSGLFDLTVDGNDANNTSGGIYWAGASTGRGPSFTFERVTVKNCRPIEGAPSGEYAAVLTTGSTWGVARDLDVVDNQYAVGWWHKGSDWQIDNLYLGPNGADYNSGAGTHSMIIQGGAGNLLSNCYFGGNGGLSQVFLWGSQRNLFVNCVNDNSWEDGFYLAALAGVGSNDNVFVGGAIMHSGGKTNNTYSSVKILDSTGNNFCGISWNGSAHTSSGNRAKYAIEETGTAGSNVVNGGAVTSTYLTNFDGRRSAGGSYITAVYGFDKSDVGTLVARTKIDVQGPYDGSAPSTSSTPKLRINNGGAISLWAGLNAYSYAWLQGIQDDGSNSVKSVRINPLGGEVLVGASGSTFGPNSDNAQALGAAGGRWSVVYAGTGTINTSDEREKQDIADLDAAEKRVAVALKGLVKKFRFKNSVAAKGDGARIHVGVIAQEVVAAFQSEGLDPMRYAIVCYDEWAADLDGDGNEIRPTGNRYGVRYEELLAFIIAAL